MHIEIFPFFRWCYAMALQSLRLRFLFNLLLCDWIFNKLTEISLGHYKDDRAAWLDRLNLSLPNIYITKWVTVVDCHADQEHVSTTVLSRPIDTKLKVSACIVYLYLNLTSLHILDALIDIKYGRFVIFGKAIFEVIPDETGLTDRGVAN